MHVVQRSELGALEGLVHRAHRAQAADARFREERARWTGRPTGVVECVPVATAGPQLEPQDQWVLRDFSGGQARARFPGKDFESDPLLAVVCTHHSGRLAGLEAGQASQRMLLAATARGLAVSLLSGSWRSPTRGRSCSGCSEGLRPQALVPAGYGSPAPSTPRRDVRDLLIND